MPIRFLLTAFEPFDGTGLNASLAACRLALDRWSGELDLRFAVLPVEYGADTAAVDRSLAEAPVDVVLHTGQSARTDRLQVERLAVNVRYAEPPPVRAQCRIEAEGPAGLFSTLPVEGLAEAIDAAGVPVEVSNHAGIYLCNHVLYCSLRRAAAGGPRVGFLHVPRLPEQAGSQGPWLPAEVTAHGIGAALRWLDRERREDPV